MLNSYDRPFIADFDPPREDCEVQLPSVVGRSTGDVITGPDGLRYILQVDYASCCDPDIPDEDDWSFHCWKLVTSPDDVDDAPVPA